MQVGASPYQPQPINYASYLSSPNYAGDPGTYSPGATSQQGFYASIYMTMMQTSVQLQAGFSQFMGQANSYQGFLPQPSQGYGTRLQRLDSDIAEIVLLYFADMDYTVLPVHDSFLAHNGFETELNKVMALAYRKKMGFAISVSLKQVKAADRCSEESYDFGEPTTSD